MVRLVIISDCTAHNLMCFSIMCLYYNLATLVYTTCYAMCCFVMLLMRDTLVGETITLLIALNEWVKSLLIKLM